MFLYIGGGKVNVPCRLHYRKEVNTMTFDEDTKRDRRELYTYHFKRMWGNRHHEVTGHLTRRSLRTLIPMMRRVK